MSAAPSSGLSERDERQLDDVSISRLEAERQLDLLASPPAALHLDRPCTVGDGIFGLETLTDRSRLDGWKAAAASGRLTRFVPASGAASRMFDAAQTIHSSSEISRPQLTERAARGDSAAQAVAELIARIGELPFAADLLATEPLVGIGPEAIGSAESVRRLLDAILTPAGLDLPALPKGLIPFHLYPSGSRTAFEEHLAEGRDLLADRQGVSRFHFTVPEARQAAFEALASRFASQHQMALQVGFSHQEPATDTLAISAGGEILRQADGRLLLRPGGHGALLRNLEDSGADVVVIKNIDNVAPESRHAEVLSWHLRMVDLLLATESRSHHLQETLEGPSWEDVLEDAEAFCRQQLAWSPQATSAEARRSQVLHRLDRPLRVCGMVRNEGEPGGGPFWVRGAEGDLSLQIVESAQIDAGDPQQASTWRDATHFNPVLLAASLRDRRGAPYRLEEFVDRRAVFVSEKTLDGHPARVLEHPGLWNGAMAHWNTLFVEVPLVTFAPVKTVLDLLRPSHRTALE